MQLFKAKISTISCGGNDGLLWSILRCHSTLSSASMIFSSIWAQQSTEKHFTLNGGGSWSRNFKNYSATVERTAFNITGFIQPAIVHQMLHSSDHDGMNDRQFFDFPPERDVFLDQLKVPMPEDIPNLKANFCKVRDQHLQTKLYSLNGEAYKAFEQPMTILSSRRCLHKMKMFRGFCPKHEGILLV